MSCQKLTTCSFKCQDKTSLSLEVTEAWKVEEKIKRVQENLRWGKSVSSLIGIPALQFDFSFKLELYSTHRRNSHYRRQVTTYRQRMRARGLDSNVIHFLPQGTKVEQWCMQDGNNFPSSRLRRQWNWRLLLKVTFICTRIATLVLNCVHIWFTKFFNLVISFFFFWLAGNFSLYQGAAHWKIGTCPRSLSFLSCSPSLLLPASNRGNFCLINDIGFDIFSSRENAKGR